MKVILFAENGQKLAKQPLRQMEVIKRGKCHETYRTLFDLHVSARLVTSYMMHDEGGKPVSKQINTAIFGCFSDARCMILVS